MITPKPVYASLRLITPGNRELSQDWGWASVRCPKCGKALHNDSESRTDKVAMCPDCGDLFYDDVAKASRPIATPNRVLVSVKPASKKSPNRQLPR